MTRSSRQELISEGPSRGPEESSERLAANWFLQAAGERTAAGCFLYFVSQTSIAGLRTQTGPFPGIGKEKAHILVGMGPSPIIHHNLRQSLIVSYGYRNDKYCLKEIRFS